jgi:hypothetical protein
LETYDAFNIIKILEAADELSLQELITYLQTYLIENNANWIEQNFNLVNQTSFEHDSFFNLQQFCTELMSKEPEKIFKSLDFVSIPEKSLISLIQNDDLQMSEVQIWEHVLKWGLAQNPEIALDPSNYSNDDFNALKNTLQRCIPFIRFHNFTPKEFLDKAFQYKKILPEELCDDLFKYFLDPNSEPSNTIEPYRIKKVKLTRIDSKIISNKHVELISKWIDKIDTSERSSNLYEFKLMFRGSRDGLIPSKFHEICDNQSRTISVIKVKDSNEILGGYNPIEWKTCKNIHSMNRYGSTKDSFIFSFKDKGDIDDYILSRVKKEHFAINNSFDLCPSFGDLVTSVDVGSYVHRYYEKKIRESSGKFIIEECEIFQIMGT